MEGGMPVSCTILGSVLVLTLTGEYAFGEPMQAVSAAIANPRFKPGMALVIDARLSRMSRSSKQFRGRAEWLASLRRQGIASRCAKIRGQLDKIASGRGAA
jgi:hypothetical protein